MNPIIIDETKCVGCSLCVKDCPNSYLYLDTVIGIYAHMTVENIMYIYEGNVSLSVNPFDSRSLMSLTLVLCRVH